MKKKTAKQLLNRLNEAYFKLHKDYEEYFWVSYMGDHSVDEKMNRAQAARDTFRSDAQLLAEVKSAMKDAPKNIRERLALWKRFFENYQTPVEAVRLKEKIVELESKILAKRAHRKEGYIDPYTKKFVPAPASKMTSMMGTHPDEKIRKACFQAKELLATGLLKEYVASVKLRNEYARLLGHEDFYAYKTLHEEGMTKKETFAIFDEVYDKTKYAKKDIKKLAKKMPGLLKPWNFSYMLAGDFTKEEDPYFQFEDALLRWGRSFAALGVDYRKGTLQLDLAERKGKYNNGFCHWPELVRYDGSRRIPGKTNFTCNVVMGQIDQGYQGFHTLFHEGGHAAHMLNTEQKDVCVNHEYAPMSTAWAETQSMFMDTIMSGIEWKTRYAKTHDGSPYPFDLFERKVRKLQLLRPMGLYGTTFVANFEREVYEANGLTVQKVKEIARKNYRKYFERGVDSLGVLNVPHIYSWESSGSYHGYGLAELALFQWRKYFYDKYGYIVDNPNVGREMSRVWKLGASKTFKEFVKLATGKKLTAAAYLESATKSVDEALEEGKARIARLKKVKPTTGKIQLNARIYMVDGKKTVADNKHSFEKMAETYARWLKQKK